MKRSIDNNMAMQTTAKPAVLDKATTSENEAIKSADRRSECESGEEVTGQGEDTMQIYKCKKDRSWLRAMVPPPPLLIASTAPR
jgi:hypothetical protein